MPRAELAMNIPCEGVLNRDPVANREYYVCIFFLGISFIRFNHQQEISFWDRSSGAVKHCKQL